MSTGIITERRKERREEKRGAGSGGNIRMSTSRDCLYQMKLKKRTVCATPAVYETMSRQPSGRRDIGEWDVRTNKKHVRSPLGGTEQE